MSGRALVLAATVAVAAAVAAALMLIGSPRTARLERLDERRIADIEALARWIERYRDDEGRLPPALGALEPMLPGAVSALDPATGAHYGYERLADGHFRLCATLDIPDKLAVEREPRPRRPFSNREIVPAVDPTGRTYCLETAERLSE
ncbi:MAG TPA: hypothetical protein VMM55_13225 [Thermohalobaculum sp.]|nr:hypothetical protein [Thermohalobaculum sp.]